MSRLSLVLLLLLSAGSVARAGGTGRGPRAAARATAAAPRPAYLSPVIVDRRLVGFTRSSTRARGARALRDGLRNTFGKKALPATLPEQTLWIPGHAFNWRSLRPAMKHFLRNPENGSFTAIYLAKEGRFVANRPGGRTLTAAEVRATKLIGLQFSRPRAGVELKSAEVAAALRALAATRLGSARLPLRVVTHSAGDTDLRVALLDHVDPVADGVKITSMVAVAPVYRGTWAGNLGKQWWFGSLIGIRQASAEVAQDSPLHARLDRDRATIDAKIDGPRIDLAVEGAPTFRIGRTGPWFTPGDGLNQSRQLRRPGVRTQVIRGLDPTPLNHIVHMMYPGVIKAIEGALTSR